jgi:hypothetical protein
MITKKQEMLRYIDTHYGPKFMIRDTSNNVTEIVLKKRELISAIIRNFDNDLNGQFSELLSSIQIKDYYFLYNDI